MRTIDLCADLGEAFGAYELGDDEALLDVVSSANVACGFHAGDPQVMARTVDRCVSRGVAIGAHPGFPDRVGFGRRHIDMSREEVRADCLYQLGALDAFARAAGSRLTHVSPHGRLGNLVVVDDAYAQGVADAVAAFGPSLRVLTFSGALQRAARQRGLRVGLLGAVDRAYEEDGTLVDRREAGATIRDPETVARRAVEMVRDGTVESRSGERIAVSVDSILLHGDNPDAVTIARLVRRALESAGVVITSA